MCCVICRLNATESLINAYIYRPDCRNCTHLLPTRCNCGRKNSCGRLSYGHPSQLMIKDTEWTLQCFDNESVNQLCYVNQTKSNQFSASLKWYKTERKKYSSHTELIPNKPVSEFWRLRLPKAHTKCQKCEILANIKVVIC